MSELKDVLKQNGWSDELLDAIERVAKSIPEPSISSNIPPKLSGHYDLHSISISTDRAFDSTRPVISR
jgi:hypothetical protein